MRSNRLLCQTEAQISPPPLTEQTSRWESIWPANHSDSAAHHFSRLRIYQCTSAPASSHLARCRGEGADSMAASMSAHAMFHPMSIPCPYHVIPCASACFILTFDATAQKRRNARSALPCPLTPLPPFTAFSQCLRPIPVYTHAAYDLEPRKRPPKDSLLSIWLYLIVCMSRLAQEHYFARSTGAIRVQLLPLTCTHFALHSLSSLPSPSTPPSSSYLLTAVDFVRGLKLSLWPCDFNRVCSRGR